MRKTVFQECVKGCCRNQLRKGKVIWWVINWTFCWFSILFEGILGDVDQDKTKEGREYKKVKRLTLEQNVAGPPTFRLRRRKEEERDTAHFIWVC